jgi:Bacteriophage protein gp37
LFGVYLMGDRSTIEWTNATWNPVTGCTRVSPGCDHCYALAFAERFRGVPNHPYEQGFDLKLWPDRLELPFSWKKPRRIFVNSMSDLFHKDVPDSFILEVFNTMILADHHIYQVLTKRPSRLVNTQLTEKIINSILRLTGSSSWPSHIWLGVSVETASYAWRVDALREIPASVRFISAEPLLGSLDGLCLEDIHWLISGGESGPKHRFCDPQWVRNLRDLCQDAGVAFFHKQWGGRTPKAGGRLLDGRTWDEFPQTPQIASISKEKTNDSITTL